MPEFFHFHGSSEPHSAGAVLSCPGVELPASDGGCVAVAGGAGKACEVQGLSLPCLYSNNSTDKGEKARQLSEMEGGGVGKELPAFNQLSGAHKKTAHALCIEIQALASRFGLERLGFLTLTFADNVQTFKEAAKRFNSLATHVLKVRYPNSIRIAERQKSGRWHFHLVVVLPVDIRSGVDFAAFERGDYQTAPPALRAEWAFWRKTAPEYGFGRTELLPVRSTAEGIARYVGGYVSKHITKREARDKGVRVVGYVGFKAGDRKACSVFSWAEKGGRAWRAKLAEFARRQGVRTMEELKWLFGPQWAFHLQQEIARIPLSECVGIQEDFQSASDAFNAGRVPQFDRNHDPIWKVPKSWQPDPVCEGCSDEEAKAGQERAAEMRLYAARMEPTMVPRGGWWQE